MSKAVLVSNPADMAMDASVYPWTQRLKYTTVAELLSDYQLANANIGRTICPVSDYFRAHLDDDVIDVEAHVYAHEEWGPTALCESMWMTHRFNHATSGPHGLAIAAWAQHYLALNLVRHHPFERARAPFQAMLYEARMKFVSPGAAYVTLAYLNAGHPNPRKLLEKPAIRRLFPADLDVASFAAPDFDAPQAAA